TTARSEPSPEPEPPASAGRKLAPTSVSQPSISDDAERRVEIEGEESVVAFSNKGARLVSWRLRRYRDAGDRPEEMVETVPGAPRPLDLETGDTEVDSRLREALYRPSAELIQLGAGPQELRFQYADSELAAEKWLRFAADGYLAELGATVHVAGRAMPTRVLWGPGVGNPTAAEVEVRGYQQPQAVLLAGRGVERVLPETAGTARSVSGSRWAGVESKYFAALLVPASPASADVRGIELPAASGGKARLATLVAVDLGTEGRVQIYVGPKDHSRLSKLGHELAQVVPVGEWIGPIVVALMRLFRWVNGYVGNYGWSVVVLTILISVVMAPFRHYSIVNGLKMAKIAPEMKVIQERYRKIPMLDPKRQDMNQEMAELYARHGMNMSTQMLVGCLPILLTMPFLIAFYRVLDVSIELRGAPFLWIGDLSQKDPLFVSPVLMGLSMFLMQKMMPTTMDPAQQRIMLIMPLVFSVMFFFAPAGLNLYWLVSNIGSIVQQGATMKLLQEKDGRGKDAGRKERKRG
ncbi:MAG TPA: membrane protein insertase YidC, partial [Vicinamibacteria bacterium]|nr:membrane protein insertase YidC [Vicinamibacteria bacterium]